MCVGNFKDFVFSRDRHVNTPNLVVFSSARNVLVGNVRRAPSELQLSSRYGSGYADSQQSHASQRPERAGFDHTARRAKAWRLCHPTIKRCRRLSRAPQAPQGEPERAPSEKSCLKSANFRGAKRGASSRLSTFRWCRNAGCMVARC